MKKTMLTLISLVFRPIVWILIVAILMVWLISKPEDWQTSGEQCVESQGDNPIGYICGAVETAGEITISVKPFLKTAASLFDDSAPAALESGNGPKIVRNDADILIRLYSDTNGNSWKNGTDTWGNYHAPGNDWYGVRVNENGRVTTVALPNNGLVWGGIGSTSDSEPLVKIC